MLVPSNVTGEIAAVTFNLSATPEYIAPFEYCDRRKVCFEANVILTGGTQNNIIDLEGSVFYGTGANQSYPIAEKSDPITILMGQTVAVTLKFCTDLDKDRIVRIALKYVSGVTPALGAGVTYTAPVPATPNLTASLYPSEQYPPEKKDEFCGCPVVIGKGDCGSCEKKHHKKESSSSSSSEEERCKEKKHHSHKKSCHKCHDK